MPLTFKETKSKFKKIQGKLKINLLIPNKLIFDGHTKTQSNTHKKLTKIGKWLNLAKQEEGRRADNSQLEMTL